MAILTEWAQRIVEANLDPDTAGGVQHADCRDGDGVPTCWVHVMEALLVEIERLRTTPPPSAPAPDYMHPCAHCGYPAAGHVEGAEPPIACDEYAPKPCPSAHLAAPGDARGVCDACGVTLPTVRRGVCFRVEEWTYDGECTRMTLRAGGDVRFEVGGTVEAFKVNTEWNR